MKKKREVLYIITKLELGGAQKVCCTLFNDICQYGYTTYLLSGTQGLLVAHVKNKPNVLLLPSFIREISCKGLINEIKNFLQIYTYIRLCVKKNRQFIVHTHSTKAGLIGRWAAFFARAPVRIHTVHGFGFHPFQNRFAWYTNYILEFITSFITSKYVCVSSNDVKIGKQLLPYFTYKHEIIRAGIDQKQFSFSMVSKKNDNKEFIFGTIACFKRQKNLFDLLKAFQKVHNLYPHATLEIIGDGYLKTQLSSWIEYNNLEQHIYLLGWKEPVSYIMQRWSVFVLSSLWEGLPCSIVEARCMKIPIVSYRTGGIDDLITHEKNGLLVPPGNWQDLAQAMIRCIKDPAWKQQLAEHPDDLKDYSYQKMVEQHAQLYQLFF